MVNNNTITEPQAPRTVVPTAAESRQSLLVEALKLLTEAAEKVAKALGESSPVVSAVRNAYVRVRDAASEQPATPATKPQGHAPSSPAQPSAKADKTAGLEEYRRLKAECKAAGLSTDGGKEQLAARLAAHNGKAKTATEATKPATEPPTQAVMLSVDAAKADLLRQFAALSVEQLQELARFIPAL